METKIRVSSAPFSVHEEYCWLASCEKDGAVIIFTGKVRNCSLGENVVSLTLEYYRSMTTKSLNEIVSEARDRWPIQRVSIIHRTGNLFPGDNIVFVGVSSVHRASAFAAVEFIMDYLKTRAPFWKRETTVHSDSWVKACKRDQEAAQRWD